MTFAATSFAETSFAADTSRIIGTFPIIYFNDDMLSFEMRINKVIEENMLLNTAIEEGLEINTGISYSLFR